METGKKFRNHISVVAEEVWGSILALLILVFVQGLPELAETSADDLSFLADKGLWIALGLTVILAVLIGTRLLVWARTYIYLEDNAIVIEKNTVNKKKYLQNTIITLPANEDDLPKLFKTCLKTNRISKYIDLQKQVSHNVVAYDPRKRKYVEVGTEEYDEYMKYLDEERARINKANDAKLLKERKKLGFTE